MYINSGDMVNENNSFEKLFIHIDITTTAYDLSNTCIWRKKEYPV